MTEERKLVTVLFADIVGSTTLGSENEPEVVRDVMARYFERMKELAETFDGTVQKFIGDAVMVVFGVPLLHDDDAERAVRCALGMQEAMATLNQELEIRLAVRVGVNSGRAVTGGAEGLIVTGDVVNVAARLQQGAEPGEIVVGVLTEELTGQAIEYGARPPVRAKGKVEPIKAFTVMKARSAVPRQARGLTTMQAPLVGRERELRLLLDTFGRVSEERRAHLFTVLGNAGVGKSRLVREALNGMAAQSAARVLRGRCLPYGKGITYWPLMEILREETGISLEDDREAAISKLERRLTTLIPAAAQHRALANRLAVLLGLELPSEAMADVPAGSVDLELSWAVRQYLQALAVERPLLIVIDDLQWAEATVIQLVEQMAMRITAHPIMLLCIARPELLEFHPGWGAGSVNATSITLNPLSAADTSALISRLLDIDELPSQLRQRLIERSEGNPLFCEEFLRMLIDEMRLVRVEDRWLAAAQATDVRVPETINALLAARLDGLPEAQKRTLQAASIAGERFTPGQVKALMPSADIESALEALRIKDLVREVASPTDASELRFKHLLIRDVAYESIPKDQRADFHERFERDLQAELGDRQNEFIEILAHHAERAFTLSRELRLGGETIRRRSERALQWNLSSAERALGRDDPRMLAASLSVAQRAAEHVVQDHNVQLRLQLLEAERLRLAARFAEALVAARDAATMAASRGKHAAGGAAHLCAARIELLRANMAACSAEASEAARLYGLAGHPIGEVEAEWTIVESRLGTGGGLTTIQRAIELADASKRSGSPFKAIGIFGTAALFASFDGFPEHAEQCLAEGTALADQLGVLSFRLDLGRGALAWLRGDHVSAEQTLRRSIDFADDRAEVWGAMTVRRLLALVLIDMRRYADADAVLEHALKDSEASGERWNRAELLARRALVAIHREDLQAADRFAQLALEMKVPGDPSGEMEASYALGQLPAAQRQDAQAKMAFSQSLQVINRNAYSHAGAQFSIGIARFLAERGRMAEATPLLDKAQSWLEQAGYSLWLDEISQIRQLTSVGSRT